MVNLIPCCCQILTSRKCNLILDKRVEIFSELNLFKLFTVYMMRVK